MMEIEFETIMETFYQWFNHRKGGTPGAMFTGKVIRAIIEPESLNELSNMLGEAGDPWIKYLSAIREVHRLCVNPSLSPNFEEVIQDFRDAFEVLHELDEKECGVSETLKVHIVSDHLCEYFTEEGITMASTNDEAVETAHQVVAKREIRSNKRMTRNLTGPLKLKRSHEFITKFNSMNKK